MKNSKGARLILYFDALFIIVLNIRSIFAIMSLIDDMKVEMYSRVRLITFWMQWVVLFLIIIGFAFYAVFQNEEDSNQFYLLLSLAELFVLLMLSLLDFHYCRVIRSYAAGAPKRKRKREKELRKAERAAERERRRQEKMLALPDIKEGLDDIDLENPIGIPDQAQDNQLTTTNAAATQKQNKNESPIKIREIEDYN